MKVIVNESEHEIPSNLTVAGLLSVLKIRPDAIAVEKNCQLVSVTEFEKTAVEDGDYFEIVTLVGGG